MNSVVQYHAAVSVLRGRIDKRQAILAAAAAVFAREGYGQAGVDVIAAEAGVAKPTVYNHFGDKKGLFRAAIAAESDRVLAEHLAVIDQLRDDGGDLRAMLEKVGHHMLVCHCDERSWAVRRLLGAELTRFPDLIDIIRGRAADRVTEALAAAEQFIALLTGPMEARSRFGTRQVPDDELWAVTRAAVTTFLRAFAGDPDRE